MLMRHLEQIRMKSNVVVKNTEGALLNPAEVLYQTDADLGWGLAAIVDNETIEAIKKCKNTPVERRFTWYAPREAGEFLVVTHQFDYIQHRFLISAYDAYTHLWVQALRTEQFCAMFTDNKEGAPPHYVLRYKLEDDALAAIEGVTALTMPCNPLKHLEHLGQMLRVVTLPEFVPSMRPNTNVMKVIVSLVRPEAILPHISIRVVGVA